MTTPSSRSGKSLTTVLLTQHQRAELDRLSEQLGQAKAELIRAGVDLVIAQHGGTVERADDESRRTNLGPTMSERIAWLEARVTELLGSTAEEASCPSR